MYLKVPGERRAENWSGATSRWPRMSYGGAFELHLDDIKLQLEWLKYRKWIFFFLIMRNLRVGEAPGLNKAAQGRLHKPHFIVFAAVIPSVPEAFSCLRVAAIVPL